MAQKKALDTTKLPILSVLILKDNNRFMARCVELDLVTEMDTPEEALQAIVEMIQEYAEDYRKNQEVYLRSPNRAHHKPYVEQILACNDRWELMELIEVRH